MTRRAALLLVILCALALSGCVRLPQNGPVHTVPAPNAAQADALVDFTPGGPKAGSAPVPLVDNFLTAIGRLATGVTLDRARAAMAAVMADIGRRFPEQSADVTLTELDLDL